MKRVEKYQWPLDIRRRLAAYGIAQILVMGGNPQLVSCPGDDTELFMLEVKEILNTVGYTTTWDGK